MKAKLTQLQSFKATYLVCSDDEEDFNEKLDEEIDVIQREWDCKILDIKFVVDNGNFSALIFCEYTEEVEREV